MSEKYPSMPNQEPEMPNQAYDYGHGDYPPINGAEELNGATEQADPLDEITLGVDPSTLDDEKLDELVDRHPVIGSKLSTLKEMRRSGLLNHEKEQNFINDIKATREEIGNEIKDKLGIPRIDEATQARQDEAMRLRALADILASIEGNETEDELMSKYHLVDEEGRMTEATMRSPLFKADTSKAFEKYMRYALNFEAMEQFEAMQGTHLKNTQAASNMRGEAHDTVATLVARDLGLPFEASRRFVAKAREARVPGLEEKMVYSIATQRFAERLVTENNHDAAAITEQLKKSLEEIIEAPMEHEKNQQ